MIREKESLNRIRQYIVDNPARWEFDPENPAATAPDPIKPYAKEYRFGANSNR